MVNPRNRIEERAKKYSSKIKSEALLKLPIDKQNALKDVIEQVYVDAAIEMMENPTGGALLSVCNKSFANGRKNAIDDALNVVRDYALKGYHGGFCKTLIREIEKFKELK